VKIISQYRFWNLKNPARDAIFIAMGFNPW
jgi:hypothetical protein